MKKIISIVAIVVLLLNVIPPVMSSSAQEITTTSSSSPFVQASGIQFTVDGHPFYFAGANSYDLFTYGDGWNTATTDAIETKFMDKAGIDNTMSQMAEDGVTVLRTWGFSNETWHGFETSKGVYNEAEFMLFDYIMYSAKQHGIKVIITLENYWEAYGGIDKKLAWEGLSGVSHTGRAQFFVNENCKENYKAYAEHFINRINHYTGVAYKDDPTIFAWDLMNEPRYQDATVNENATGTSLRAWVDEMGSYIKSIDKNHMVCVGLEGHEAKYGFGGNEGNPFVYIQQSPYIDFCSAHPYPDEGWAGLSPEQTKTLMKMWIDDAHNVVGKPFICGEFNTHGNKDLYWAAVFGTIEEEGAAGGLFWEYNYRRLSDFTVMHGDSILTYFKGFSDRMAAKNGTNTTPTVAPTVVPTIVPTVVPTIAPTIAPTVVPTVAPTTVPTITPTPTIPSTTGLTLKTTTNQWDAGYQINMSIVNTSSSTINGWTLKLKKSEFSISNAWCVNLKEDGDYLVITPLSWNSSIQAGQSVDFGFQGTGKVITNFTYILN